MNRGARAALFGAASVLSGLPAAYAAPANPLVLLSAGPQQDDMDALSSIRRELRSHGRVDVITFNVEAPAIVRAARDNQHPEWLNASLSEADRVAVARALGATLSVTVTKGDKKSLQIQIYRSTGANQAVQIAGNSKDDASAIEDAAYHAPPPAINAAVPPATPAPIATAPPAIPNPVTVTPPPTAPAPAAVTPPPAAPTPVAAVPAPVTAPPVTPVVPPVVVVQPPAAPPTPTVTPVPVAPAPPAAPPVATNTPDPVTPAPAPPIAATLPKPPPVATVPAPPPQKRPTAVAAIPDPQKNAGNSPDNPIVVTNTPAPPTTTPQGDGRQSDRDQMQAIAPFIAKGDQALDRDEVAEAISYYKQAVDGAPTLSAPRLRLAKAYQQGGFEDKALDEAKRALMVAPNSVEVQEFLIQIDSANSTAQGTVTLYEALIAKSPGDPTAHLGLGDALWNAGLLDRAETEYKSAIKLSASGDTKAPIQLVRLYAAQARYGDVLATLKTLGPSSYPVAARVIHNRLDTLISMMASGREAFDAGKSSHEQFYDTAKTVAAQAASLADFVDKVKPPSENKVSHLSLSLAASLIAQEAEVLRTFIETSDADQEDHAVQLEKAAQSQILTAHAAEQKSGLFGAKE